MTFLKVKHSSWSKGYISFKFFTNFAGFFWLTTHWCQEKSRNSSACYMFIEQLSINIHANRDLTLKVIEIKLLKLAKLIK